MATCHVELGCVLQTVNDLLHPAGGGQSHGAAGSRGQDKGENIWQTKDLFR